VAAGFGVVFTTTHMDIYARKDSSDYDLIVSRGHKLK
jgi:hypothetical protein